MHYVNFNSLITYAHNQPSSVFFPHPQAPNSSNLNDMVYSFIATRTGFCRLGKFYQNDVSSYFFKLFWQKDVALTISLKSF